jgi:hypothetical protein
VTKTFRGILKPKELLYAAMANDPIASLVKGCDRMHNFQSMPGVFTIPKQVEYLAEGEEDILPMLLQGKVKIWEIGAISLVSGTCLVIVAFRAVAGFLTMLEP